MRTGCWLSVCLGAGIALAGCRSGPELVDVGGTVTFDGRPVPEGDIIFLAADGTVAPDAGKIRDGQFHFRAKVGGKKVQINAVRQERGPGAMGEEYVYRGYIPSRYNVETTLTAEVAAGRANHFDFALESDKK